jgi:hypothetical protein
MNDSRANEYSDDDAKRKKNNKSRGTDAHASHDRKSIPSLGKEPNGLQAERKEK